LAHSSEWGSTVDAIVCVIFVLSSAFATVDHKITQTTVSSMQF
jgi:hypothetical protein